RGSGGRPGGHRRLCPFPAESPPSPAKQQTDRTGGVEMTTIRPLLGITIGDPAGIGPEITLKALKEEEFYRLSRPLVIGSARVIDRKSTRLNSSHVKISYA